VKILFLSNLYPPDFLGGYEIGCAQMVHALREQGHDVLVATAAPRHPVPTVDRVRRVFRLVDEWNPNSMGTERLLLELKSAESRLVNAYNVHALTGLLEEFAPDVAFVSNLVGLGGLGLMACLQYLKVPWVWHLGDCVPRLLCSKFWIYDRVIPGLADELSRRMQGHFILVSQQLREEIESSGIRLGGDVEVIPYWIAGGRPAARTSYGPQGPLRIMSAGYVSREKGIDLLIEAAGRLRALGLDDFALDVYGQVEDPYFAYLIRELDLAAHVRLMGVRPHGELLELYGQYDVFAFPTRDREPFGLVPLEAAARGCVPLITRRCGIAEWLVHGVHCLKVERSSESYASVLGAILEGEIALEPIARRGVAAAWRDFHIDAILPRIERTLAAAARQSRAGAGTAAEAYRMARVAEQLTQVLILDSLKVA
jgi:glycogen(starch) synthase